MVIDDLVAGKMADSRYLMDTLGMMQQLDVLPVPVTNQRLSSQLWTRDSGAWEATPWKSDRGSTAL
jgi:hypothetical protein